MEGDQVASLLLGMAADGFVDFSKAELLDRRWKLKLLWMCKAYQAKKQSETLNLRLNQTVSALSHASSDLFKSMWERSDSIIATMTELAMPWLDRDITPKKDYNEYSDLIEAYKIRFGDMNDPVWRKKVEEAVVAMKKQRLGPNNG